jgi:hypothetical protein
VTASQKISLARQAYTSAGKSVARAVVMGLATERKAMTILDLWGGGTSARAFREALPDATVVSAEVDPELQPLLLHDSQTHGYAYHMGDAATAPGSYDAIWLDLCSQANKESERVIRATSAKLARGGFFALTIMPARETDRVLTGESRLLQLPLWLESITQLKVRLLFPYRRDNGLPMWLVILQQDKLSWFHDEARFNEVREDLVEEGYWSELSLYMGMPVAVLHLLDQEASKKPPKRVVKMSDLTPDQRRAITALIDADRSGKRHTLSTEFGL